MILRYLQIIEITKDNKKLKKIQREGYRSVTRNKKSIF